MPSFDVVSEVEMHELSNAVDQANREVGTRFDFRGSDAKFEQKGNELTLMADGAFQLKQMMDILRNKMVKRGIDTGCLDIAEPETSNLKVKQKVTVREGLDKETAKKVVKLIKEAKLKVQSAIQDQQVRVTGKKRDDLQAVMAMLKDQKLDLPLQYTNFRD
ncbi:MAG: YajQ family cyclic di-GMP-binding protein [Gammaproteobacteria bacterium]|nr:YajQ family cyclic di-GMP-binding protein [Gammaproteobacteria bacterium]MCF6261028.1 YajQ family cyclic di-GMP-binding protein [Gammaproteobacteria bacterium]